MKTLGMVGGLGPESTIQYYRLLTSGYRERRPGVSHPHILINSIDVSKVLTLAGDDRRKELADYLLAAITQLVRAGADFGILTANTPHLVFDEVAARSPLPLISIVEAACDHAKAHSHKVLGLFGTRSTMQAGFYQHVFTKYGIEVVIPDSQEQNYVHEKYVNELVNGVFLPATRDGLLAIADAMKRRHKIDGLILGGTELPLLLNEETGLGIPLLDTTRIHVNSALDRMLE